MARIRSLHPGQWTDEDFVGCSPLARLLALGLRNEADDGGVFEWKPATLKMRLLPADACDVAELLAELEGAKIIRRFEENGRAYGAIRNFLVFNSPEKPRTIHPRQEWVDEYVGKGAKKGHDRFANGSGQVGDNSPTPRRLLADPSDKERDKEREGEKDKKDVRAGPPPEPAARAAEPGQYAFQASIIRLKAADYERWKQSFPRLDLAAQLEQLDAWLSSEDAKPEQRKRWFHVVAGALAKRNALAVKPPPEQQAKSRSVITLTGRGDEIANYFKGIPGMDPDARYPDEIEDARPAGRPS